MQGLTRGHAFREKARTTLATTLAATPAFNIQGFAGGTLYVPSGSSITSIQVWLNPYSETDVNTQPPGGTLPAPVYYRLHNTSADAAEDFNVSTGCCYNLPPDIFGGGAMKLVANASGAVEISFKG